MVHVRKVDGNTEIFGNQGALFMNAMTWWDHTTGSVWSQVWGRAIEGPLKGTELELLPAQTIPWGAWKEQYPNTLLMTNGLGRFSFGGEHFRGNYVIGISVGDAAKAYPYAAAEEKEVINDSIGDLPVLVVVNPQTRAVHTYFRQVDDTVLTFAKQEGFLLDSETGSTWDPVNGLAVSGPLRGEALRPAPYIPAFRVAWQDFYPHSEFYADP